MSGLKENTCCELTLITPAHNEEAGIAQAVAEFASVLNGLTESWEIILVDDGSQDGTYSVVERIAAQDPRVKAVKLSRNFGKESALLAGLERARGEATITIDSDLQHPPSLIPEMVSRWKEGAKVVHGVKRDRIDGLWSQWRAAVANGLITRLSGFDMNNASDFKLLDRVAVNAVVSALRERRRFYRGLAEWIGFRQTDVYFDVAERAQGASKWSFLGLLSLAGTAVVSFTSAPLRIVTVLGLLTLVLGTVIAVEALRSWIIGASVSGFATIIMTLLIIGSFIMISLGIIGEYIGKIYEEVKARPHYLVEKATSITDSDEISAA